MKMIACRVSPNEIEKSLVQNEAEQFYGVFGHSFLKFKLKMPKYLFMLYFHVYELFYYQSAKAESLGRPKAAW